jgi:hypothetical protein
MMLLRWSSHDAVVIYANTVAKSPFQVDDSKQMKQRRLEHSVKHMKN